MIVRLGLMGFVAIGGLLAALTLAPVAVATRASHQLGAGHRHDQGRWLGQATLRQRRPVAAAASYSSGVR